MNGNSDTTGHSSPEITVQILGASLLKEAIERLLATVSEVKIVADEGHVLLLVGAEGQSYLRQSRLIGKRRRKEHFVLVTNAQDIDYRLVREAPIEVFVGVGESLATLVQGINAASRSEPFCSPQLVPALIAAAVNSAAAHSEREPPPPNGAWQRPQMDRPAKRHSGPRTLAAEEEDGEEADDLDGTDIYADVYAAELAPLTEENSVSQEVRTQRLAVALGLSEREAEVAIEAVKGFSNIEIAELLNISLPTIKYHLYRAYQKLGIRRRSQLAAALFVPTSDS